ncbi:hypothetical protein ACFROC_10000 [Nocardia tengchongensis]|uniref:hypothetical protein n=1 Tax=Nocardia tengchongensis TaxID=2055889 RepID=UPI0036C4228A
MGTFDDAVSRRLREQRDANSAARGQASADATARQQAASEMTAGLQDLARYLASRITARTIALEPKSKWYQAVSTSPAGYVLIEHSTLSSFDVVEARTVCVLLPTGGIWHYSRVGIGMRPTSCTVDIAAQFNRGDAVSAPPYNFFVDPQTRRLSARHFYAADDVVPPSIEPQEALADIAARLINAS